MVSKKTNSIVRSPRHRPWLSICVLITAAGAMLGCSPQVRNHGHLVDPEALSQIRPGITDKQQVAGILGSPSSVSTFDDDRWYYISQQTERYSFYDEDITKQDVLTISFDGRGVVTGVDEHGMELAKAINISDDETPTLGKELTILEQLVGNIGRFENGPSQGGVPGPSRPTLP
ncbi:MAG: outer membrane protein assembly factor BamE [Pseudomonadota bacterium]